MRMIIRGVTLIILMAALAVGFTVPASANSKYAAYVVHAESGDVLFNRYSTSRRYPASLTKMMTLYLLFEELEAGNITLKTKLKVSKTANGQPPSKLGLKAGSTIDVETAIKALVVKSANDVAVVVAEQISGSEWRFAQKMTAKARSMGMRQTTFRNASGLPNSKQRTTARDMAILGRRVMQDYPQYWHYFSSKKFTWNGKTYSSHNSLVKHYEGADGIKTGYTRSSGFNLVTSAERDGQRLIGVVLGGRSSRTRDRHMRDILTKAFAAIRAKPTLITALHRKKPTPSMKPTLLAALETQKEVPTIAENDALRNEILAAATLIPSAVETEPSIATDRLGALIAAAETDDFNEFQRAKIAALDVSSGFFGEGDVQMVNEFSWGVQIGAYSSKALAQKELEDAAFKGGLMDRARSVVPMVRDDGDMLYRARITKLSEIEAATACTGLKDKGIQCFVVDNSAAE